MRAIVIFLLAGCLLWFSLQAFRSVRASEDGGLQPAAGYLLPPDAPAEDPEPAPKAMDSEPSPQATEGTIPPRESAPAAPTRSEGETSSSVEQTPSARDAPAWAESHSLVANEVELASLLFSDAAAVPAFLEGPGKSIPSGRKELALAFHRLLLGRLDEARRLAADLESSEGVRVSEAAFLRGVLFAGSTAAPAAASAESPLVLAASLAMLARRGEEGLTSGRYREAARAFGELLSGALEAPWQIGRESFQAWSDALARAQARYRWDRGADWPSITVTVEPGDSLITVRKRVLRDHPDLLLCTGQIERANGLRKGLIHPGDLLKIPTSRANILVDLDAHWALYRLDDEVVAAWEIGTGKPGSETPPGEYSVGEKTPKPMWFRSGHAPVPYGDPENPLGSRWIAWQNPSGADTGLGFHGTSDPLSIGEDQSQGCVRMRQQAVEELFEILPRDAKIVVRP